MIDFRKKVRNWIADRMARSMAPGDAWMALSTARRFRQEERFSSEEERSYGAFVSYVSANLQKSHAQLFQDLFVSQHFGEKEGGYFVEFGAADGVKHSNTYHLEKELGWTGILAEPCRGWHEALSRNRQATIDKRCVYTRTAGDVLFQESMEKEISGIASKDSNDAWRTSRRTGCRDSYTVPSVGLTDLLREHKAPRRIDYLSIDTEGTEFEILSDFDFNRFQATIITVEHNFLPSRIKIRRLLQSHGYCEVFPYFSKWDGWFVLPTSSRG